MPAPSSDAMIFVRDVRVLIDREVLLPATSLTAQSGETVVLRGPNGSGKTTLLRVLAGLMPPSEGDVSVAGASVDVCDVGFRKRVAALIGLPPMARNLTLLEQLTMVGASWSGDVTNAQEDALNLLDHFQVSHLQHRFPHELSSGQTQLFTLALTFARECDVLLLDEPEQRLDADRLGLVYEKLTELRDRGTTMVIATHSDQLTDNFADHVLTLTP
ncbi:MAG TPA: ATP-binding cassette domain-containing protein [Beutenbergiaceae bacterium]|nr:ATP-binding cassette domain-containing protein [Beutenbergiaceae bacterium]